MHEARDSTNRGRVLSGGALLLAAGLGAAQAHFALAYAPLALLTLGGPLLLAAGAAGWVGGLRPGGSRDLDLVFVFVGFLLLPAPGAALLALTEGALCAWRRGSDDPRRADSTAALVLGVSFAQFGASATGLPGAGGPWTGALTLMALGLVVRGLALAWSLALAGPLPTARELRARAGIDALQIAAAAVLAREIGAGRFVASLALALVFLASAALHAALARSRAQLACESRRATQNQLDLDTLHALGREILASLDTNHVLAVLDREAHKLFEIDAFAVALTDPGSSRVRAVYRRKNGCDPLRAQVELGDQATRWVLEELRGRRFDDLPAEPPPSTGAGSLLEADSRSALVVPMIVESRVLGLLAVQSRQPHAYDDQRLAVLTTMAQQAAVAIDNSRHHRLATIDSLTGFFLRDYFFRWLAEEQQRLRRYGGTLAVLMIDLDGFKNVNDEYGHLAGDRYLADIAHIVRLELRSADVACRLGGDEFCVMLPQTDLAGARIIAERIRSAVSRRVVSINDAAVRTTVSIGVAAYPEQATRDLADLVRLADEALYRAKREGRDRVAPCAA